MTMPPEGEYGPWNPGIRSQMPMELLHLATIFRSENVFTSIAHAVELRSLTGFSLSELVVFRPERLALHELLIRVTADFAVPDGTRIGDLGLNFREIARLLLSRYLEPHMDSIVAAFERARRDAKKIIDGAVSSLGRGWGLEQIAAFERSATAAGDSTEAAAFKSVARTLSALFATQGQAWGSSELIAAMAFDLTSNLAGSECIGRALDPWLNQAVREQGYRLLPRQEQPVVINTKGPSASGKSTLRPLLKKLAGDIGIEWSDFALISPDIWRKQLLDYSSLGSAYKYAGAFTSDELQIVDQKLDRYMANKHRRGQTSHLLIDRFRFDSFAPDSDEAGSNLLTRFGHSVYLFFMITPPEMLVERAWTRGLEFGRYKAVDDTLAHAVEAYSGMPDVFFTWVRRSDKRMQFEFLDNTVRLGERPRTVAFGDNETFNVLDVKGTLDIQRYARIDEDAAAAEFLYADKAMLAPEKNTKFLQRCVKAFRRVNFADQASGRVYLRIESGKTVLKDTVAFASAIESPDTLAGIRAVAPDAFAASEPESQRAEYLSSSNAAAAPPTLGQWGSLA
ncbi:MAG: zeta toxin family protein [Pseudomonadota bacterium]|nr:zeta toxin family protein [Pseudomonadota bacterium]